MKKKKKKKPKKKNVYKKKSLVFELIFNDLSKTITIKDKIKIVNISLLLLMVDYLKQYLSYRNKTIDGGSNFLEFLFLFFISTCLYDIKYYNHQYVSIFFLIILQIIKAIIKFFFIYINYIDMIIDLTIEIFLGLCEAFVYSYFKYLMQIKFFSPYKTTYIFGFINGTITLILFILFSYIPVGDLGAVTYKDKKYFDNFWFIYDNFNIVQLVTLFSLSIFLGASRLLFNITINNFTVCHLFLLLQSMNLSQNISPEIGKIDELIPKIVFNICFLFEFIFGLVFLEIIEFNCFGLNEYNKKNIRKRAKEDIIIRGNTKRETDLIELTTINDLITDNNNNNN